MNDLYRAIQADLTRFIDRVSRDPNRLPDEVETWDDIPFDGLRKPPRWLTKMFLTGCAINAVGICVGVVLDVLGIIEFM